MTKRYEPITGEVIRTTLLAVLVRDDAGDEVWVPRSVCEDGDSLEKGDTDVRVEPWFAEKEGMA